MAQVPKMETACAFPPGVVHDHGYRGCHEATAVKAAQTAITSFLTGLAGESQIKICENPECRVRLFVVEAGLGTMIPVCPSCYVGVLDEEDESSG